MNISPDWTVYWQYGLFKLNSTLVFTWLVMALLTVGSWLVTRRLTSGDRIPRWQNLLEVLVGGMEKQVADIIHRRPRQYLPFLGSLFLFILASNLLGVIPYFDPPTGSLSTTTALALCVFVAVPAYGIAATGVRAYLANYVKPSPILLPLNVFGEVARSLALAVRLFGNTMSGSTVAAILLALAPLFLPVVFHALGLLTGIIQAYIFAVLAAVFIGAATEVHESSADPDPNNEKPVHKGENAHG